ncbi:odorant receptor 131-2-like [Conger conger]|uniref:odorant receptor 131-2-like n=1 Tax=Conger conger TaxID=82655 RepID=UPI002A5B0CC6|nr:odorant receptor 131-2-like [Conger conger]
MENASTISSNAQEYLSDTHLLLFGFSLIPVVFFTYLNCVMLFTLKRKAAFQGVPRYILFGHMLLADSLQFLCSMISYLIAVVKVYMSNGLCGVFVSLANITNHISPLNLAVMALERYSAICFPLRHAEIATSKWTGVAIVGFIIIYTYIAIMVEAKSASSDKSKAAKARNTVLLHLIQLGLCLSSLSVTPLSALVSRLEAHTSDNVSALVSRLEAHTSDNVRYVNFMVFVILPRCLSPLIYGMRDEMFRPVFIYYFTFGLKSKIKPEVN